VSKFDGAVDISEFDVVVEALVEVDSFSELVKYCVGEGADALEVFSVVCVVRSEVDLVVDVIVDDDFCCSKLVV